MCVCICIHAEFLGVSVPHAAFHRNGWKFSPASEVSLLGCFLDRSACRRSRAVAVPSGMTGCEGSAFEVHIIC